MEAPVLLIIFKKPEQTRIVFERIRQARPKRLYVAADGPRDGNAREAELCAQTRAILQDVDWDCQLITLLRERNLGITEAMTSAFTWYFDQEEYGVILEDDTVPDPSFFGYMDEVLPRYKDDERVFLATGCNLGKAPAGLAYSYFFYPYSIIWGWGSYRRSWRRHQAYWTQDDVMLTRGGTLDAIMVDNYENQVWRHVVDRVQRHELDSWDYCFGLTMLKHGAFCITPAKNLVTNIGFVPDATHTNNPDSHLANLPSESLELPLRHPSFIYRSRVAEDAFLYKGQKMERYLSFSQIGQIALSKIRHTTRRLMGQDGQGDVAF